MSGEKIEIVAFERRKHDTLIGYRQNNRVVYASVSTDLDESSAKQRGYEQVRNALAYEQTLDVPSIDGKEMQIIETFTPSLPKIENIKLIGDSYVQFAENDTEKTINFTVSALDQYGQPIELQWSWTGATEGKLNVTPSDKEITVSVSAEGVNDSLIVQVYPYVEPEPQPPTLEEQLAERDRQIIELKAEQILTGEVVERNGIQQQELLELLIDMGVI